MPPVDAFWHIVNFFAPALVTGFLAAGATKLVWRRELLRAGWFGLGAWASAAMAVVSASGLLVFQHDGKVATYVAMVVACAVTLWWAGFHRDGR